MNAHLEEHELSAAVAGLDLDEKASEHLRSCLVCREQVAAMEELIEARRQELVGHEPDWQAQHDQIMAQLPASGEVVPIDRHWRRPLLAAAASLVLAVGAVVLYLGQRGATPEMGSDRAEQILAEVQETLESEEIPGFGALGYAISGDQDSQEESDSDTASSSAWDVALAALEDDSRRYQVPGFEALDMLVPTVADLDSMINERDTEAS
jgi:hypothetical protein